MSPHPGGRPAAVALGVFAGYLALALLGLCWAMVDGTASPVWPAAGWAVALLRLQGVRLWPAVSLAGWAAIALTGSAAPWWADLLVALGNGLAAVAAVRCADRLGLGPRLSRSRDALALCAVGAVAAATSAGIGALVLWACGALDGWLALRALMGWFLGDLVGVLTIAPFVLAWVGGRAQRPMEGWWRLAGCLAATALAAWASFAGNDARYPLAWLPTVPLVLTAMVCGGRGVTSAIVVVAAVAVWGTNSGSGPFAAPALGDLRLLSLQAFVAVAAVSTALLSLAVAERRRVQAQLVSEAALQRAARELEQRVRERTRELDAARAAAEAASRAKSDFLARMSHEIRTPLNGLLGAGHLLRQTPLQPTQARLLDIQARAGESLLAVINDILDISKIEAGRLEVEQLPFELGAPLREALDVVRAQAQAKGLRLQAPTVLPSQHVLGDPARLRQVLLNLLGNAVKFTEQGSVRLEVAPAESAAGWWRFSVHDSGIGIPPAVRARLFQAFEQGETSTSRRFGGTGLGLAISRELVELMGGRIEVNSLPGAGSSFHVTLPLPAAADASAAAPAALADGEAVAAATGAVPCRLRVLLAEDEPVNQIIATAMLEGAGHEVVVAGDGARAVQAVAAGGFDVVLMDMRMPGMDGLQATRRIRELPGAPARVPVVGLTAEARSEQIAACLASGMDRVLTKPCDSALLLRTLQAVVAAA